LTSTGSEGNERHTQMTTDYQDQDRLSTISKAFKFSSNLASACC